MSLTFRRCSKDELQIAEGSGILTWKGSGYGVQDCGYHLAGWRTDSGDSLFPAGEGLDSQDAG